MIGAISGMRHKENQNSEKGKIKIPGCCKFYVSIQKINFVGEKGEKGDGLQGPKGDAGKPGKIFSNFNYLNF